MRFRKFNKKDNEKENVEEVRDLGSEENLNQSLDTSDVLTIEGLRRTLNSCSNCGVSWYDDHISLDCSECGGYSMSRPCPTCNGECGNKWRRDVKASRVKKQAQWHGTCSLNSTWKATVLEPNLPEDNNANYQTSLCLEKSLIHQTQMLSNQ